MTHEVEDFAGDNHVVEAIHKLLDVRSVVPVVQVQDVNKGSAEPLEAALDGEVEGLDVVAAVVDLLGNRLIAGMRVVRVLRH